MIRSICEPCEKGDNGNRGSGQDGAALAAIPLNAELIHHAKRAS